MIIRECQRIVGLFTWLKIIKSTRYCQKNELFPNFSILYIAVKCKVSALADLQKIVGL